METQFLKPAESFVQFLRKGCSTFHVVNECCERLTSSGFKRLNEKTNWNSEVKPLGKYFFSRNQSAIVAFSVGGKYIEGNGFTIVAAHTDSPYLKLKPVSKIDSNGYCLLGVETYGGGIWNSWLDRDLGLAGRVMVEENGVLQSKLVKIDECIGIIPSLAIHLRDSKDRDSVKLDCEKMLPPVMSLKEKNGEDSKQKEEIFCRHDTDLVNYICEHINVKPGSIIDFELFLYDLNEARIAGLKKELITGRSLDNLGCSYCALEGFINSSYIESEDNIRVMVLYDNEEIGSRTLMGAGSTILGNIIQGMNHTEETERICRRRSFILSCDMAHAVHPSYSDKHETNHKPHLNEGMVVKYNGRQRYATSSLSSTIVQKICRDAGVPYQMFVLRQDMNGGSTIGPIVSTNEGIYTVDVGLPQLAMHSIRETMGSKDVKYGIDFVKACLEGYSKMSDPLDN